MYLIVGLMVFTRIDRNFHLELGLLAQALRHRSHSGCHWRNSCSEVWARNLPQSEPTNTFHLTYHICHYSSSTGTNRSNNSKALRYLQHLWFPRIGTTNSLSPSWLTTVLLIHYMISSSPWAHAFRLEWSYGFQIYATYYYESTGID